METMQKTYEKKKAIFKGWQIVWYILGVIETLLTFRFVLKALAANPLSGFTNLIYTLSAPLVAPFVGIFRTTVTQGSVVEWSTIVAILVYLVLAWGIVYLLDLFLPLTPSDVA